MAPRGRGRPRKYNLGDARMEIAVEHLAKKEWGFDEKVVREAAAELLAEYKEDGAWFFIELNNYALLVEKILEYQEMNDHGGSYGAGNKDESLQDETPTEHALAISGEADKYTFGPNIEEVAEGEGLNGQYQLMNEAAEDTDETRFMLPSPESEKAVVIRSRRPCYGWIVDDDEDEDEPQELLELTPAGEISRVISVAKNEENLRKRKSLWDLKPDDP